MLDSPLGPPTPLPAPVIVPHPDFDDDETGEGSDPAGRKSLGAALTGIEPMETGTSRANFLLFLYFTPFSLRYLPIRFSKAAALL